jgi:hypothetical protein
MADYESQKPRQSFFDVTRSIKSQGVASLMQNLIPSDR